ncbi:hypothetical protein H7X46_01035 [Pseudonocardia sp. C8]|uniref:hypothetical protein n=1 Tax=Pseudonocardia sp. C8 TaxID=2762759 RepID=UPI001642AC3E|nr:hypothetical protein [Pseudonocardia sp. C8]MBC3189651.1 hypothetical protein [Pseudonocardia sp. C8]
MSTSGGKTEDMSGRAVPAAGGGNGFGRSVLAAACWAAVSLILTFAVAGAPPSAEAAGRVTGSLLVATLLAALVTWLIVRRRARWAFWKLALLALPFFLVLRVLGSVPG